MSFVNFNLIILCEMIKLNDALKRKNLREHYSRRLAMYHPKYLPNNSRCLSLFFII